MGTAKSDRINRLVYILDNATSWVPSALLAKMLGASERTVRNYIAELNDTGKQRIESSKDGYRIARDGSSAQHPATDLRPSGQRPATTGQPGSAASQTNTVDERCDYVVSHLITADGDVSVYDLADELYISESTLASSVMPHVRQKLKQFDLAIETHDFRMRLTGREQDKRRLLGQIATHNMYGYFTSTKTLEELFPDFDVTGILNRLVQICQSSELFLNNYALNNLLTHILVIIIRLQQNNELGERDGFVDADALVAQFPQRDEIMNCANAISRYFEQEFGCSIPNADFQQIIVLIALSIERYTYDELSFDKLAGLMDQTFLDAVLRISNEMVARYGIPSLDESLLLQLTLHMFNAYQRAMYHVSYPNPLAAQIKSDYAPVYDMAVFFAHRFALDLGVELSENEIAFIAFHIGAYLERTAAPANSATCIVIVEEYHDFARQLVNDLESALGNELSIIGIMSCDGYLASHPESDIVITTIDVPVHNAQKILIGPILTKPNLRKIRDNLSDVLEAKRMGQARQFLRRVLRPELFCRNAPVAEPDACIDYLGSRCIEQGFADEGFIADVHVRERVSSTAFTDCLAIPHSMGSYASRSFIAVAHNDTPIPWGRHRVHFVLMIGIAQDEMGYFRDALDLIIELFSSMDRTTRLLQTDSFEEFLTEFTRSMS